MLVRSIADQLTLSSSLCRQILAEGPKTPCPLPPPNEPKGKGRVESSTRSISYDTPAGSSTMDGRSSLYDDVASIAVSASCGQNNAGPEDDFVQSLDHLKVRGSGQYTCPEGLSCKRGGVVDGNIRVFKRNSEFRYVSTAILLQPAARQLTPPVRLGLTWNVTRGCINVTSRAARTRKASPASTNLDAINAT